MNKKFNLIVIAIVGIALLAACAAPAPAAANTTSSQPFTGAKLNLNTVSGDELLATIPGFPSRMVREFQEYRPYASIQQFRREIGKYIDDAQVAEYEKYVYVPISFNDSDPATLQQIPGLDETEAGTLISSRPFASQDEFLTKLSQYISADELEIAKSYLGDN